MNRNKRLKIYERYIEPEYTRVFNFLYSRMNKEKELAQDLTQSTMEMAWYKLDQLKDLGASRAWLMKIAAREVSRYCKMQKSQMRSAYIEQGYDSFEEDFAGDLNQMEEDILTKIVKQEDGLNAMVALEQVEEKYRTVIDLRIIQELKFSEISDILEIKEATARVVYMRGIQHLQKQYNAITRGGTACAR